MAGAGRAAAGVKEVGTDCRLRFVAGIPESPESGKFSPGSIPPPPGSILGWVKGVDDDSLLVLV